MINPGDMVGKVTPDEVEILPLPKFSFSMPPIIAPSLLSADFGNLAADLQMVNNSKAGLVHCDIMDGVFVPNISFGLPVVAAIKKHSRLPLDVHLMIVQPERYVEAFAKAGADILTVHWEACTHVHRVIQQIKEAGMKAGLALNPHTPVAWVEDILPDLDLLLIMSVNPGFGGQKFIPNSLKKIREARKLITQYSAQCQIEVDGGVGFENAAALVAAGTDILVAGNSVFGHPDPIGAIRRLQELK
jgi:ribulose-phosphate 3-epimerase